MSERTIKGITDALLGTEEVVGMLDAHDRPYAKGLHLGWAVAHEIAARQNHAREQVEAKHVLMRLRGLVRGGGRA